MDEENDERIVISSSAAISPEAVAGKGFTTSMRGYQPAEVRQFLNRVADELAAAVAREAELRRSLHELQARAAHPELDEAVLTASLGEHAGRLIASARETAAAITAEAERTAAATLRDAEYRIARIRQEADTLMARRVEEADGVSASLRQSAEADARAVRDQAQAEAEAAIQAARSHGKEMVAEARAVRERMLGDLSRRRRVAEVQLEQLRVARARLVEAYDVVRRTLEEVTAELAAAEPEARLAAEAVGRRMADLDPPPPLRLADPPLRSPLTSSPTSSLPSRRPEAPSRGYEPAGRPTLPDSPFSHPSTSGSFQPTQPAPSSMPAPAVSAPEPQPASPSLPPPVPPAWIERAGGTGSPSSTPMQPMPPMPPMPPSVAVPPLVPNAGVGGGPHSADDEDEPTDPGTWTGAGFGPPRDVGSSHRPADASAPPSAPDHSSGPPSGPSDRAPGSPPEPASGPSSAPASGGGNGGSPSPSAPSAPTDSAPSWSAPASVPAPAQATRPPPPPRPPLRPQTVADSLSSRGRPVPVDAGARRATATSVGLRPMPPDLPPEVPAAAPEQPPELATAEVPTVRSSANGPAPVEELFARLRDQVPALAAQPPPTAQAQAAQVAASEAVVDEEARARRDEQLDPLEAELTRSLKRILQDEQNDVLERVRQGGRAATPPLLAALDHQEAAFTAAASPVLLAAFRAGGAETDDATGSALGLALAEALSAPIRERLQRVVAGGGDDPEELAEAVRAAYRHTKLQEIEPVVRHHTTAAHALGAYAATAAGRLQRWVVDADAPCPDCHDNTLAGATPKGEPFPTGQNHPPAHPGCRCLLVPID